MKEQQQQFTAEEIKYAINCIKEWTKWSEKNYLVGSAIDSQVHRVEDTIAYKYNLAIITTVKLHKMLFNILPKEVKQNDNITL